MKRSGVHLYNGASNPCRYRLISGRIHYKTRYDCSETEGASRCKSDPTTEVILWKEKKDLREAIGQWNQAKIYAFLLQKVIKWIFNPPAGSHHGGLWERIIITVRKVMRVVLNEQRLDDDSLVTFVYKAEAILNGRPQTEVSDDPRDLQSSDQQPLSIPTLWTHPFSRCILQRWLLPTRKMSENRWTFMIDSKKPSVPVVERE